jgi:ABC-2 type transport system ATP-binding protein
MHHLCDQIPIGFKQRLSFAAATMHAPKVLFLDEPTSGMDPLSRRKFWRQVSAMAQNGCTVMVTTHFMDEAENCDRIALLYMGKIIHLGTCDELKAKVKTDENPHPTLDDAFIQLIEAYHA